jgi:hypothetical protein
MSGLARIGVQCFVCGGVFRVYRYDYEVRNRKYCSSACAASSARLARPKKEELGYLYHLQKMSTNELSVHYGVSKGTIYNWMKSLGVSTRTLGKAISISQTGRPASEARKSAIGRAHKGKRCPWMVGTQNPIHKNSTSGMHYSKSGKRDDIGIYVRSRWEANYCRYLTHLQKEGRIKKWEYEPRTFVFYGVTRGCVSYLPDFRLTYPDGSIEYIEVKGRETSKDRTKWKRMAKFYPEVKLTVVREADYKSLAVNFGGLPFWER